MQLAQLAFRSPIALPSSSTLYRVQRIVPVPGSIAIGTVNVAPAGTMAARFDLVQAEVGYFAADAETALYETMARRSASTMSLSALGTRDLSTLTTTQSLNLFDLRPHGFDWPAVQSPRYAPTWQLADDIRQAGFDGIAYASAQRDKAGCYALLARR